MGDQHLRDFQDNDKTIPTILTTSQKLSTGVDARNIRHIVLMRPIRSIIEFKQIIGRGTRTYDGKDFFTIWDFVKAHENFNDPEWDGEPLEPEPPGEPRPPQPGPEPGPDEPGEPGGGGEEEPPREKIVVKLSDGKARNIRYIASTTYWSPEGKPISATEFLERLFGDLKGIVADEDQLRTMWSDPDNRERFLAQLSDRGYDRDRLDDIRRLTLYFLDSLRDLAESFVDEGLYGEVPESLRHHIDYDSIARDLSADFSETEIAGERIVYACH